MKCHRCKGSGIFITTMARSMNGKHYMYGECSGCEGTGIDKYSDEFKALFQKKIEYSPYISGITRE